MPRGIPNAKLNLLPSNNPVKVINEPELLDQIQAQQETITILQKEIDLLKQNSAVLEKRNKELSFQNETYNYELLQIYRRLFRA